MSYQPYPWLQMRGDGVWKMQISQVVALVLPDEGALPWSGVA